MVLKVFREDLCSWEKTMASKELITQDFAFEPPKLGWGKEKMTVTEEETMWAQGEEIKPDSEPPLTEIIPIGDALGVRIHGQGRYL